MFHLLSLVVFMACRPVHGGTASIEGAVKLPGAKPVSSSNERYQVKTGEVAAPEPAVAVVYLEGTFPADAASASTNKAQVLQKDFQFMPGTLAVQKGTVVAFPNRDDGYHNVFSYSKTKRFDLGRYRKDEKPATVLFDKPGVVKLYCEIHEHMRATILVLDTPHFTTTDAAGAFKLEKLPAGQFMLKAWIDEKTLLEKPVTLKDGETLRIDFSGP